MSSVLGNSYQLSKVISLLEKTNAEIMRQLNIEDNSEDEFYKYVSDLSLGAIDSGCGPSTIDYSGFGSVDDGCERK